MLASQLGSESGSVQSISDDMCETLSFLKSKGILHFDAHLHNILLDGKRPILTDFGLALDKQFNLSKSEQRFFQNHSHYDLGEFISCLGMQFLNRRRSLA
jgi:serine/threonine protein kinase